MTIYIMIIFAPIISMTVKIEFEIKLQTIILVIIFLKIQHTYKIYIVLNISLYNSYEFN